MLWYIESDTQVKIKGVRALGGDYVVDADITAKLIDRKGVEVLEDIGFSYVEDSAGDYIGFVPHTLDLTEGKPYTLRVLIIVGDKWLSIDIRGTARRKTPEN